MNWAEYAPSISRWSYEIGRNIIERIAIESLPNSSVTTTSRFTMASTSMIATCGCGMIGVPISAPKTPGFVIVKVPPLISSGVSFLARARSARSTSAREQAEQVHLLGVLDDRHDEPLGVVDRHRDAEVDVALDDDLVAADLGVDPRPVRDRVDDGAHDERHERELDAVAPLVARVQLLAQVDDARHVDLDHRRDVRRRLDRVAHVARDDLADVRERARLLEAVGRACPWRPEREPAARAGAGAGGSGGCGRGRRAAGAAALARRPARKRSTSFLVTRPPRPVPGIWAMSRLCSATMRATTGDMKPRASPLPLDRLRRRGRRSAGASATVCSAVGAVARGSVTRPGMCGRRPGPRPGASSATVRGRRLPATASSAAGPERAVAGVDHRDAGADRDGLALGGEDLGDHARRRGRDLGVDLVGRDLDDRLVGLDLVADLLGPARDRALRDAHAHLRHDDVDGGSGAHGLFFGCGVCSTSGGLVDDQYACSFRAAARTSSTCGMNAFSSGGENGTGVSGAASRVTGPSSDSKASSAIVAAISAPKPPVRVSSCSTSALLVRVTEASTASLSHGMIVRRSMHLDLRAVVGRELLGGLERGVHHRAPGDDRHVAALARDARLAEVERHVAVGHLALDAAVEVLVLEVQHRVGVADRADEQRLGVGRRGRAGDLEARDVGEARLGVLRVERPAREAAARRDSARRTGSACRRGSAAWLRPSRGGPRRTR